jgi:hypothetical protein
LRRNSHRLILAEDLRELVTDALVLGEDAENTSSLRRGLYLLWISTVTHKTIFLEDAAVAWNGFPYLRGKLGERIFAENLRDRNFAVCASLIAKTMAQDAADRSCRLLVLEAEAAGCLGSIFPTWPWYLKVAVVEFLKERANSSVGKTTTGAASTAARRLWGALTQMGRQSEARELALTMIDEPSTCSSWLVLAKASGASTDLHSRALLTAARRATGEQELDAVLAKLPLGEATKVAKAAGVDVWQEVVKPRLRTTVRGRAKVTHEILQVTENEASVVEGLARWRARTAGRVESEIIVAMESGSRWVVLLEIFMRTSRWEEAVQLATAHVRGWRPKHPGHVLSEILPVAKLQQLRDCVAVFRPRLLEELDVVLDELKAVLRE